MGEKTDERADEERQLDECMAIAARIGAARGWGETVIATLTAALLARRGQREILAAQERITATVSALSEAQADAVAWAYRVVAGEKLGQRGYQLIAQALVEITGGHAPIERGAGILPDKRIVELDARIAELEAACCCGAAALRMHDVGSPTAVELEKIARGA